MGKGIVFQITSSLFFSYTSCNFSPPRHPRVCKPPPLWFGSARFDASGFHPQPLLTFEDFLGEAMRAF